MAVITNENARQRLVRLVEQYQTDLLRLCYIQLHDTALAEDAVQETFIKAYRSFPVLSRGLQRKDLADANCRQHLSRHDSLRMVSPSGSSNYA